MSLTLPDLDRAWTFDDWPELPDDGHRYEIVDGNLLVTPPPTQVHQIEAGALRDQLFRAAPSGWRVVSELPLPLGPDHVRVPDVVVHRWPPHAPGSDPRNPVTVADVGLVVEVVSPRSRRTDRFAKPAEYADAGIGLFWRLETDPERVLHAFVLRSGRYEPVELVATRCAVPAPWGLVEVDVTALVG